MAYAGTSAGSYSSQYRASEFEGSQVGGNTGDTGGMGGFTSMFGGMSKGMGIAQNIFETADLYHKAKAIHSEYRNLQRMAQQALDQGFQTGMDIGREGAEFTGEMTAAFGKSGTLLEGSPLLVLADTQAKIEQNVARAILDARIRYSELYRQARKAKKAAKWAKRSANIKVVDTVIKAIASIYGGGAGGFGG